MIMSTPDPRANAYCFPYPVASISPSIITKVHIAQCFRFYRACSQAQYHLTRTAALQNVAAKDRVTGGIWTSKSASKESFSVRAEGDSTGWYKGPQTRTRLGFQSWPCHCPRGLDLGKMTLIFLIGKLRVRLDDFRCHISLQRGIVR